MELGLCKRYVFYYFEELLWTQNVGVESFDNMSNIGKEKKQKLADNFYVSIFLI